MVGGEHSLKIQAPKLLQCGIDSGLKILIDRIPDLFDESMNQRVTEVIVEEARLPWFW